MVRRWRFKSPIRLHQFRRVPNLPRMGGIALSRPPSKQRALLPLRSFGCRWRQAECRSYQAAPDASEPCPDALKSPSPLQSLQSGKGQPVGRLAALPYGSASVLGGVTASGGVRSVEPCCHSKVSPGKSLKRLPARFPACRPRRCQKGIPYSRSCTAWAGRPSRPECKRFARPSRRISG